MKVTFVQGNYDGYIYCFTESGELAWKAKLEGGNAIGLAASGGVLYASTPRTIYAFEIETGKMSWKLEYSGSAPIVKHNKVFLVSYGRLVAISNGKILWEKNLGIGTDLYENPFVAVGDKSIVVVRNLGERPLNLFVLDLNGNLVGNFTFEKGEEPAGAPVVAGNVVLVPVVSQEKSYAKIYILWKGTVKLNEITYYGTEVARPRLSVAYGNVYALWWLGELRDAKNTLTVYGDKKRPVIENVSVESDAGEIKVRAIVGDENSGIYRVLLFYSVNNSQWIAEDMKPERRYIIEPIGGYGFQEEPFSAKIPATRSIVKFVVVAVDNVGNYAFSEGEFRGETSKTPGKSEKTPGFEALLCLVAIALVMWMRKK